MISVSPIGSDSDAEGDNKPLTPMNVDSGAMVLVPHGNSSDGHHGVGVVLESDAGPSVEFFSGVRGEVKGKQVLGVASRMLRPPKMPAFDGDSNRLDNGRQVCGRFLSLSKALWEGVRLMEHTFFFFDRVGDRYLNPE